MGQGRDFISVFDPVLSLTPRRRSTLRRAHVTLTYMHTPHSEMHAHTNTHACACMHSSPSRLHVFKAISEVRVAGVCTALGPVSRTQWSHKRRVNAGGEFRKSGRLGEFRK